RITGKVAIDFVLFLFTRQADLIGVDHDDVIAGIQERRIGSFMLAHQEHSSAAGQLAQDHVLSINDMQTAANGAIGGAFWSPWNTSPALVGTIIKTSGTEGPMSNPIRFNMYVHHR